MHRDSTCGDDLMSYTSAKLDIQFYDYHPEQSDFYNEVIEGLQTSPKRISPKFFYDETGSRLFEQICQLPEYYPTRTEQKILEDNANEIANVIGSYPYILEPGCGSCEKIKLLLDILKPKAYVPMDISKDFLQASAQAVSSEFPWLDVHAACVDFTEPMQLPFCPENVRKLAFFPGSSIGNFEPAYARQFLRHVVDLVGPAGGMLIGVDLKKDEQILHDAYNDKSGVTADFNLNVLSRINDELNADFELDNFNHQAFYNAELGRVEMHLISQKAQIIQIGEHSINFDHGESIHTENSYKYTVQEFQVLACEVGFRPVHVWTDPDELFSVQYFEVTDNWI